MEKKERKSMLNHGFSPESLLMHCIFPNNGSVKPDLTLTSTFSFKNAEEGERAFKVAYRLPGWEKIVQRQPYIYSRISNPTIDECEEKLRLLEGTECCSLHATGMAAIANVFLGFLRPGDLLLYSSPTYGGTDHFINTYIKQILGVKCIPFFSWENKQEIIKKINETGDKLRMIFVETPGNPTNALFDIRMCREIADEYSSHDKNVVLAVDNTFMGPLWQNCTLHGADIVIYSGTKHLGGHSDFNMGICCSNANFMEVIKGFRPFLGNIPSPFTAWQLLRSLETFPLRIKAQAESAVEIADFLFKHPKVKDVYYLGALKNDRDQEIFDRQCSSPGTMIAFTVKGGKRGAFRVLNRFELATLAVSLGSTESFVEHPACMTHADVDPEFKKLIGIPNDMIRFSVGLELVDDLINDLEHALA